jgi:hypothetical protein
MSGNILTGSYFYLENDLIKFKRSNSKMRRGSGNRFGNPMSYFSKLLIIYIINVRENRRGNQKWTIQRHWQHWAYKAQNKDK